ncbi:MAG: hypothetical protein IPP94_03110 [Ignavibacteria bacterium]|nr:hypothetical protein [Ignavibacteria bacterium]
MTPEKFRTVGAGILSIVAVGLFMGVHGSFDGGIERKSARMAATDTLEYLRAYDYRTLSMAFDSCVVTCQFGEICLPDQDSLAIRFTEYFEEYHGTNDTIPDINAAARTMPFAVGGPTQMSVWRCLIVQRPDSAVPYIIPNACAWTLRVHDAATGSWLATLDSAGFDAGRGAYADQFPGCFGLMNEDSLSFEMLVFDVHAFVPEGVDSVFLSFAMPNLGGAPAMGNILDFTLLDQKESDATFAAHMSKRPRAGRQSPAMAMTVCPNPISGRARCSLIHDTPLRFDLSLFATNGERVRRIFTGEKPTGTNIFPVDASGLPSGAYLLVCRDEAGGTLASKSIRIQR